MKKIAIIRRNGLGDLLCTYPLICHLRKIYPDAYIKLFVDQSNAPLLAFFPEKIDFALIPKKGNKYFNLLKLALRFRFENFDLAISAKTSPMKMMNLFLFAIGAKKAVAFVNKKTFLVNSGVLYDKLALQHDHQALKTLKLIDNNITTIESSYEPRLKVDPSLKQNYSSGLKEPILLLSGSTTNAKARLDEKRYADLANAVFEKWGFSTLLVSLEKDRMRAEKIASFLKSPFQIHFPRNFDEFMVLLDESDLYFVGDGGAAHIGAGLKKQELVLFGGSSSKIWRPLNEKATVLEGYPDVNSISDDEMWSVLNKKCEEVLKCKNI